MNERALWELLEERAPQVSWSEIVLERPQPAPVAAPVVEAVAPLDPVDAVLALESARAVVRLRACVVDGVRGHRVEVEYQGELAYVLEAPAAVYLADEVESAGVSWARARGLAVEHADAT